MRRSRLWATLLLACASLAAHAATPSNGARMQWFADAKSGIFVHWGIYAVDGKPYWSKVPGLLYIPLPDDRLDPQLTVLALALDGPVWLFHDDEVKAIEKNG